MWIQKLTQKGKCKLGYTLIDQTYVYKDLCKRKDWLGMETCSTIFPELEGSISYYITDQPY